MKVQLLNFAPAALALLATMHGVQSVEETSIVKKSLRGIADSAVTSDVAKEYGDIFKVIIAPSSIKNDNHSCESYCHTLPGNYGGYSWSSKNGVGTCKCTITDDHHQDTKDSSADGCKNYCYSPKGGHGYSWSSENGVGTCKCTTSEDHHHDTKQAAKDSSADGCKNYCYSLKGGHGMSWSSENGVGTCKCTTSEDHHHDAKQAAKDSSADGCKNYCYSLKGGHGMSWSSENGVGTCKCTTSGNVGQEVSSIEKHPSKEKDKSASSSSLDKASSVPSSVTDGEGCKEYCHSLHGRHGHGYSWKSGSSAKNGVFSCKCTRSTSV